RQAGARRGGRGAAPGRRALRSRRDRRDPSEAPRRVVPDQGPRLDRRGRLLLPRRPRRRRHHLGGLDDQRGRSRGRAAQARRRPRGGGDRGARPAARPRGQGLHREPTTRRRRLRPRAARVDADPPRPARVSAPGRVRGRAAQDAGRESEPQGAPRARGRRLRSHARGGRPMATQQLFPKITQQGLDDLRRRIGVPITDTLEPWCHEATRDNIRHYAHGIGDDNPLWCDPAYAASTRWGGIIAPPSFLFATSRIISGYVGGLAGVHAMWAGADWRWHLPVRRNDTITTEAWLSDLIEHQTKFAGRSIQQIYHVDFMNQRGELVAAAESWCFRTDRDLAREEGTKYTALKAKAEKRYTDDELAEFHR